MLAKKCKQQCTLRWLVPKQQKVSPNKMSKIYAKDACLAQDSKLLPIFFPALLDTKALDFYVSHKSCCWSLHARHLNKYEIVWLQREACFVFLVCALRNHTGFKLSKHILRDCRLNKMANELSLTKTKAFVPRRFVLG